MKIGTQIPFGQGDGMRDARLIDLLQSVRSGMTAAFSFFVGTLPWGYSWHAIAVKLLFCCLFASIVYHGEIRKLFRHHEAEE